MQEVVVSPVEEIGGVLPGLAEQVWTNARQAPEAVQFVRPAPVSRAWPVRRSVRGGDVPVTCAQFRDDVHSLARGFLAAGVGHGDRIGLVSRTRYEWTLVDYALWAIGAVSVPVFETASADQLGWILSDAGVVGCVVETSDQAELVASRRSDLPALRDVWQIDAGDLTDLAGQGHAVDDAVVDGRRRRVTGGDMATIVYTSGTTGRPKGCVLTHRSIHCDVSAAVSVLPQLLHPEANTVLFLPLAHAFARMIQVGVVQTRTTMVHSADIAGVLEQLRRHRPTFVLAVPRVFEKLHSRAQQKAEGSHRAWLFQLAERVAVRYSRGRDRSWGPNPLLRLARGGFDPLVYRKLRAALGGRCSAAIVGGAPLGERLGHFFRGAGLLVLEGYGLTEASPALTANTPTTQRIGTVGRPLPGVKIRIADDGEILARGDPVFPGYWNNSEATRAVFTQDGWMRTGDLGELDSDGFLRITGRQKEIIVTASGQNLAPTPIEEAIRADPLVSQCMLIGDGRPYVAALVTIDPSAWDRWRSEHGRSDDATVAELRDDPELCGEIQAAVDRANATVSRAEQVKTFRILPRDLTESDGELTPILKIKKSVVQEHFSDDVEALYQGH
ncbi:AMP-dependent synthetase/ligase [Salinispora tropica]|uniref:Acyl-CoA synthetase n=1 Tax=Salinispora tropica (strain ATCC BAA-916 / DSM 44818 / JCM 13857 / NBRC 105044 / CNB-440) TaxID=369723 RepID=A4X7K8_SALTO|nr:long-chain fatty acid--CoA ligase [Salinispora tropica]ABP54858.1 AMP-dependent synthetase and ligase [Salinispora tropica CNB-440]